MAPSIKQMAVRANGAHRNILAALIDGTQYQLRSTSDARGYSTAKGTLLKWGCIESVRHSHAEPPRCLVTDRGRELLAYLRANKEQP